MDALDLAQYSVEAHFGIAFPGCAFKLHAVERVWGTSSGGNRWEQMGNRCVLWLQVEKGQ
jgi:hypothetical protein